jgi:hypothetical protein
VLGQQIVPRSGLTATQEILDSERRKYAAKLDQFSDIDIVNAVLEAQPQAVLSRGTVQYLTLYSNA